MSKMGKVMKSKGFTTTELLVVVFVIAVLAVVTWIFINPPEVAKRTRDAARLINLADFKQAINASVTEATSSAVAVLCPNSAYPCKGASTDGTTVANGTGWLKMNLAAQKSVNMSTLLTDPINEGTYHYSFCANGDQWEISAKLESDTEKARLSSDSGNDENLYEVGTDLNLIAPNGGSCTY